MKIIKRIVNIIKEIHNPTPEITSKDLIENLKDLTKNQLTREIVWETKRKLGKTEKISKKQRKSLKEKSKKELLKILLILKTNKSLKTDAKSKKIK